MLEWVGVKEGWFGGWKKDSYPVDGGIRGYNYSRAQFEPGEIEMLRRVFADKARSRGGDKDTPQIHQDVGSKQDWSQGVRKDELFEVIKGLPGYGGIKMKDFEYVVEEAGFASNGGVDFDEFVEVSGSS